ncbi:hypothetical protein SDRG_02284 [Saprolegnia diclina VS20]|uniref:Zinc finger PHD-type domain-containing protein n=1 Tax=Saprolegnia diclina (strain VS20) TaxID=1156394 RepID=T0R0A9_SAPDV|nr:hypothetical protein SDRG_02284 [Saprolegnia diclina VS20]EQC40386.1 hypothetical protein SDRG_02284 [Saprolegnia diclina VS20]|eukprot:XP_008606085.1 hypothetical protein SDRG_02284 [Saprolegnia diclina VS20]
MSETPPEQSTISSEAIACTTSPLPAMASPMRDERSAPRCAPVDVECIFPSTWGTSRAYERLRHLRAIEAAAYVHQAQRQRSLDASLPPAYTTTAIRRIDALMEIQRRECFRLERAHARHDEHATHTCMYAARNEDGEIIRPEFVRDRSWPPKEFALKSMPKQGAGRGGGRKRKVPDKTPAQLDEERLAYSYERVCVECTTKVSALWRQVDAKMADPSPDAQLVYLKKDDLCLNCYVKRTCPIKSRAQLAAKKRKEKLKEDKVAQKVKPAPVVVAPVVEAPIMAASPVATSLVHDVIEHDEHDADESSDDKKRKKSSKKSSKKKKKKAKKSATSSPPNSPVADVVLSPSNTDDERKRSSKKRARDHSVTPKAKASKTETARERELRAIGQYCPVCNVVYEDDDANDFICCDACEMWVHSACDPKLDTFKLQELADSNAKYVGPCCSQKR